MKLVISTRAEIGRNPMAFNWSWSHCGEGPFFTPRTTRAAKAGQPSVSSILISCGQRNVPATGSIAGEISSPNPTAARSRAMELTPSQSGRFGVTSKSMTGSLTPIASETGWPTGNSAGSNSKMPSWSSPSSSSLPEHIMPEDSTPRILRGFLSRLKSSPGI